MRIVLLCVGALITLTLMGSVQCAKQSKGQKGRRCGDSRCRAGQKCSTQPGGQKVCACRNLCPDREHLVCGSDGRTYHNKCELHRIACVETRRLRIDHRGACPSNVDIDVKDVEKMSATSQLPLVCYQVERDELRQLLVDWIKRRSVQKGTPYQTATRTLFSECDLDRNQVLDANEMLRCTEKGDLDIKDTDAHILRGLCIDALISVLSRQQHWVLTQAEFQHLMEPNFVPPTKDCQLEDKKYVDGAETKVDCNLCVCACGDWVCTGAPCSKKGNILGAPGPVTQGSLPSQDQRETFLRGFKAAAEVHVPAVMDEVSSKRQHRDIARQLDSLTPDGQH